MIVYLFSTWRTPVCVFVPLDLSSDRLCSYCCDVLVISKVVGSWLSFSAVVDIGLSSDVCWFNLGQIMMFFPSLVHLLVFLHLFGKSGCKFFISFCTKHWFFFSYLILEGWQSATPDNTRLWLMSSFFFPNCTLHPWYVLALNRCFQSSSCIYLFILHFTSMIFAPLSKFWNRWINCISRFLYLDLIHMNLIAAFFFLTKAVSHLKF